MCLTCIVHYSTTTRNGSPWTLALQRHCRAHTKAINNITKCFVGVCFLFVVYFLFLILIHTYIYSIAKIDIDNLCIALQLTAAAALVSFLSHFNVKVKVISCLQRFAIVNFVFALFWHGYGDPCMLFICQYVNFEYYNL